MGACIGSPDAKLFEGAEQRTPSDLCGAPDDLVGKTVRVLGTAGEAGAVLAPPFGEAAAVAIRVRICRDTEEPGGRNKVLFTGLSAVSFNIVDGQNSILVDVGDPACWRFHMSETHKAMNICRRGGDLVSGGTAKGQYQQTKVRPWAMQFYTEFSAGKDSLNEITELDGHGQQINRPRRGIEYSIKVGDRVAVLGELAKTVAGGLKLVAGSSAAVMTNNPAIDKLIKTLPEVNLPPSTAREVGMSKAP